jgi:hypothetical protein
MMHKTMEFLHGLVTTRVRITADAVTVEMNGLTILYYRILRQGECLQTYSLGTTRAESLECCGYRTRPLEVVVTQGGRGRKEKKTGGV